MAGDTGGGGETGGRAPRIGRRDRGQGREDGAQRRPRKAELSQRWSRVDKGDREEEDSEEPGTGTLRLPSVRPWHPELLGVRQGTERGQCPSDRPG